MCVIIIPVCRRFSDLAKVIYPKRLIFAADWKTGNGILFTGSRRSEGNIFVMAESEIFSHPVRPDLCGHFVIWQSLS